MKMAKQFRLGQGATFRHSLLLTSPISNGDITALAEQEFDCVCSQIFDCTHDGDGIVVSGGFVDVSSSFPEKKHALSVVSLCS